jgi:hypothetical protein
LAEQRAAGARDGRRRLDLVRYRVLRDGDGGQRGQVDRGVGDLAERTRLERDSSRCCRAEPRVVVRRLRDGVMVERSRDGEIRRENERGGCSESMNRLHCPVSIPSGAPNVKGERRCLTPRRTADNVPIFMRRPQSSARRPLRLAAASIFVIAVMTITGFEATSHAHAPKPDGWHEAGIQGDRAHDERVGSCSICRLAHETSSAPVAPKAVSAPLPVLALSTRPLVAPANEPTSSDHSPRAPPCPASC